MGLLPHFFSLNLYNFVIFLYYSFTETNHDGIDMNIETLKNVILCQIKELDAIEKFDETWTAEQVELALERHGYEAPEVTFNDDAYKIIIDKEFVIYSETLDFSSCESAIDCVTMEANFCIQSAYNGLMREIIENYLKYA